ncbi:MAG TPA: MFS transporter, partial [Chloroflexota bacterium]|nr:MFS transporter [Chloroflexota bacterium]
FALRVPMGIWSDRIGRRKPFIVAGMMIAAVAGAGLALSTNPEWLIVWRGMSGVTAAAWVAFTVLFCSYFPTDQTTRAMGYLTFVAGASQMVATYSGGHIAQEWGWTVPFYVSAVLGVLGTVAVLPLAEKPLAVRGSANVRHMVAVGTVPLLLAVSVVAMLGSWTLWATSNGFTLVYAEQLGASRSDLGTLNTAVQLSYTVCTIGSAFLAERMGLKWAIILGVAMQAVGSLMVPWTDSLLLVGLTQVLGGAGRGFSYPLLMSLSIRDVSPSDRATAMGVFQAIYAIGGFVGPASTGILGDNFGMNSIFIIAGLAAALGVVVVAAKVPSREG